VAIAIVLKGRSTGEKKHVTRENIIIIIIIIIIQTLVCPFATNQMKQAMKVSLPYYGTNRCEPT